MATALGLAVPGDVVLALRIPLVRDRLDQLTPDVEHADLDVARIADGKVDLRGRVERVRIVLLQRHRRVVGVLPEEAEVAEAEELLPDPVRIRPELEADVLVHQVERDDPVLDPARPIVDDHLMVVYYGTV